MNVCKWSYVHGVIARISGDTVMILGTVNLGISSCDRKPRGNLSCSRTAGKYRKSFFCCSILLGFLMVMKLETMKYDGLAILLSMHTHPSHKGLSELLIVTSPSCKDYYRTRRRHTRNIFCGNFGNFRFCFFWVGLAEHTLSCWSVLLSTF